jgi:hypothetical protein
MSCETDLRRRRKALRLPLLARGMRGAVLADEPRWERLTSTEKSMVSPDGTARSVEVKEKQGITIRACSKESQGPGA